MTREEAIAASEEKWRKLLNDEKTIGYARHTCALCDHTVSLRQDADCEGCPLADAGYKCLADNSAWQKIYYYTKESPNIRYFSQIKDPEVEGWFREIHGALKRLKGESQELSAPQEKINAVLELIDQCGGFNGVHHKQWVLDQVVRTLTGCPTVKKHAKDYRGQDYTYDALGESDDYLKWVEAHCEGEDGPNTYLWDEGITP